MPGEIKIPLFRNITEDEMNNMKQQHCMRTKSFKKEAVIFHTGEYNSELGIVLSGSVYVENIDLWGTRTILTDIAPGQIFAETYALTGEPLMVDAVAAQACEILFLNVKKLLASTYTESTWQGKLLRNLLIISSRKNLILSSRIFCTSPKKIRARLLMYLSNCSIKFGTSEFDIPFDRQELADYLNLDRSALSKEMAAMQKDGLIRYHKNHFQITAEME